MTAGIVVAPFSNSDIRDWPAEAYAKLIDILDRRWPGDGLIHVVGTASQSSRACAIVRDCDPTRVRNECGRLAWSDVVARIRDAACVIGNNSGVAHLGGYYGVPTVCVFGGSHQRLEWRPIGSNVVVVSRAIGCSPCHLDHGAACRYDKACLRQIDPADVADAALDVMSHAGTGPVELESRR